MPNTTATGPYDVTLRTAPSGTELGLILDRDRETGLPRFRESRVQPIPPRQSQGALTWTHQDPNVDMVWAMDDWSKGALHPYYRDDERGFYAQANGVDARWDGVLALGMQKSATRLLGFLVTNPGAETNSTTGWTTTGDVTATAATAAAKSGTYGFTLTLTGATTALFDNSLASSVVGLRSRTLTIGAYVRRSSGTGSIRLETIHAVGANGASSTVTSSSFTYVSITETIDATETSFTVRFAFPSQVNGDVFHVDDVFIVSTAGITCRGVAEYGDLLYGIFGNLLCSWNESSDTWICRTSNASEFNSIASYGANIYAALIDGTAYVYGSAGTWTTSTLVAPGQDSNFFVVSRGTLWKAILASIDSTNHGIYSSTNPVNGGSWSTAYVVGSVDRDITGLYSINDTIFVGKEDGAHLYLRVYADGASGDLFTNITNEYVNMVSSTNFNRGTEFKGWLYLVASQQAFFRYSEATLQDLTSLLFAPRLTDFGGRIRALTNDTAQLWLSVDTATADTSTTKDTWLMAAIPIGNNLRIHTIEKARIGIPDWMTVNRGYLWSLGRIYNSDLASYEPAPYRWTLPTNVASPFADASPVINTSGTIDFSKWHGGLPNISKALVKVDLLVQNTDASNTIQVQFGVDGAVNTTTSLGTVTTTTTTTPTVVTLNASDLSTPLTSAVGREFDFRLTFTAAASTSPRLYAIAFHFALRPPIIRQWELFARFGEVTMKNGQPNPVSKTTQLSNLNTLETQVFPIQIVQDFDGDRTQTAYYAVIKSVDRIMEDDDRARRGLPSMGGELYRIVIQQTD